MRVLSIENSGSDGSVALLCDEQVIYSESFMSPRGRGTGLFKSLAKIMKNARDFDIVLVGTGPGSYNGLRASIATAWGIARARNIRLAGVSSLLGYDASDYFVVGDARAGQWFFAQVCQNQLISAPQLLPPSEAIQKLNFSLPVFSTAPLRGLDQATVQCPRAELLAQHLAQAGTAEPIYLKPPYITVPRATT